MASKAKKTEALYTVTIDGAESAPMTLKLAEAAMKDYADCEVSIHSHPDGALRSSNIKTSKPKKAAAKAKPAKAAKEAKPAKAAKPAKDATMADKLVELAKRKTGATAAEFNEFTGWTGAPWKWLFSNPNGTGYLDRRWLKLEVIKREAKDGERPAIAYKVAA